MTISFTSDEFRVSSTQTLSDLWASLANGSPSATTPYSAGTYIRRFRHDASLDSYDFNTYEIEADIGVRVQNSGTVTFARGLAFFGFHAESSNNDAARDLIVESGGKFTVGSNKSLNGTALGFSRDTLLRFGARHTGGAHEVAIINSGGELEVLGAVLAVGGGAIEYETGSICRVTNGIVNLFEGASNNDQSQLRIFTDDCVIDGLEVYGEEGSGGNIPVFTIVCSPTLFRGYRPSNLKRGIALSNNRGGVTVSVEGYDPTNVQEDILLRSPSGQINAVALINAIPRPEDLTVLTLFESNGNTGSNQGIGYYRVTYTVVATDESGNFLGGAQLYVVDSDSSNREVNSTLSAVRNFSDDRVISGFTKFADGRTTVNIDLADWTSGTEGSGASTAYDNRRPIFIISSKYGFETIPLVGQDPLSEQLQPLILVDNFSTPQTESTVIQRWGTTFLTITYHDTPTTAHGKSWTIEIDCEGNDLEDVYWFKELLQNLGGTYLSFQPGGYTSAINSDKGKVVTNGAATAVLTYYDNANRRWWIGNVDGTFSNSDSITITGGTGAGALLSSGAVNADTEGNTFKRPGDNFWQWWSSFIRDTSGTFRTAGANDNNSVSPSFQGVLLTNYGAGTVTQMQADDGSVYVPPTSVPVVFEGVVSGSHVVGIATATVGAVATGDTLFSQVVTTDPFTYSHVYEGDLNFRFHIRNSPPAGPYYEPFDGSDVIRATGFSQIVNQQLQAQP